MVWGHKWTDRLLRRQSCLNSSEACHLVCERLLKDSRIGTCPDICSLQIKEPIEIMLLKGWQAAYYVRYLKRIIILNKHTRLMARDTNVCDSHNNSQEFLHLGQIRPLISI